MHASRTIPVTRHAIRVRGTVQGVGFRPMVYRAARAERLGGFVRNDGEGVVIEVEGSVDALARFSEAIVAHAPPLARIEGLEVTEVAPRGDLDFRVASSEPRAGATGASIPPDTATCEACLAELFDPTSRRFRHPFVTCTDCGPRFTIIRELPYDRAQTTMAPFPMCDACRAEYEDPGDRRFHAEPIACNACGPHVRLVVRGVRDTVGDQALLRAARLLREGAIVAVKGLGGYQLAVDARNEAAVRRLRERKRRPDKPFAIMARDLATAREIVAVGAGAEALLTSPARPIVLLPRHGTVAPGVAPALAELGVMLPTTPIHHLLLADGPSLLVMTSGNVADEPIAKDDDEALRKLERVADAFLAHDRPIHTRADDSVVTVTHPVRRARGFAPSPIALLHDAPPILAVGAELKNAVCVTRAREAHLSQHVGDLGSLEARAFFEEVASKLGRLLGVTPRAVAHDLHPEYASTRWALATGLPAVAVQHHHAHVASCLAEHGREGPAIGVAFDGTGCGPAGELWGGEILAFDLRGFRRLGHLRPLPLPGGEAAIREPWRLAVAAIHDAGAPPGHPRAGAILRMIRGNVACPRATGAGRWFDAFAAILRVREHVTYEAQAAIELEALARTAADGPPYPFAIEDGDPFVLDLRPTVQAVLREPDRALAASRVHTTMAAAVEAACRRARQETGLSTVALSGGCFQNALFTARARVRLVAAGFEVLTHRLVPPNDGGIALGQAAVAACRLASRTEEGDVPRHTG